MSAPRSSGARTDGVTLSFRVYVLLLVGVVSIFLPVGVRLAMRDPCETLLWIAFIAAANLRDIPMLPRVGFTTSVAAPVTVAASVLLPLPQAVLVKLVGKINQREFRRGTSPWLIAFNRTQGAMAAGGAAWAASLVERSDLSGLVAGTLVAGMVYHFLNSAAVTVALALLGRLSIGQAAKGSTAPFPRYAVDFSLVVGLALLIVVLYAEVDPWSVLLLALPLWLGYNALRSARESEDRAEELAARVRELETLNALASDLLSARRPEQVEVIGAARLRTALDASEVVVSVLGELPTHLQVVKVPGAAGAAIGVPFDIPERSMEVVEAAAGLLGMALQRLELEEELAEEERARAKLAGKIIEEGTRERSRIALEIHDEVLPYLAAAEIQADNVRSAITEAELVRVDQLAAATSQAVHGGINRLRQVLDTLNDQIVVPGGLRQALVAALNQLRLHGIDGRLEAPDPLPALPLAVEILVLEVVRGCLTNVTKHAQAHNVVVETDVTDTLIAVQVRDDGRGFDPGHVPAGHHGLALMQQRVELARGRFTVRSAESGGTRVEVEVPL